MKDLRVDWLRPAGLEMAVFMWKASSGAVCLCLASAVAKSALLALLCNSSSATQSNRYMVLSGIVVGN